MDTLGWPTGEALYDLIRRDTDTIFLAMSAGKDALAAWLALRPHFRRIIPLYYYLVPGLEFVEEGLRYYEEFFRTKIVRLQHPSLWRMLGNLVFQPGDRARLIEEAAIRENRFGYDEMRDWVAADFGLPKGTWIAVGLRAVDSPQRMMTLRRYGPINQKRKAFYPVWDFNKARLLAAIRQAGVKLPREYRVFGRSFDGIDLRFLWGVRKHFPNDYQTILRWFPLAELEIRRYESHAKRQQAQGQAGP